MSLSPEERKAYKKAYFATYYATHREKYLIRARAYRDFRRTHPESRLAHNKIRNTYNKAYRKAHPEKAKAWRIAHPEQCASSNKAYRAAHQEEYINHSRLRKYGLSEMEFDTLFKSQCGVCAICKKADWRGRRPYVDHDHVTGKVRGLLCINCNSALGHIKDSVPNLEFMIEYLRKSH